MWEYRLRKIYILSNSPQPVITFQHWHIHLLFYELENYFLYRWHSRSSLDCVLGKTFFMEHNTATHFENILASKSSLRPSLSTKRVGAPNFLVFLMVPPPLTLTCWQYLEQLSLKSAAASSPFSFSFGQIKFPHKEGLLAFILTRDMKKTIIGFQNCFSFSPY